MPTEINARSDDSSKSNNVILESREKIPEIVDYLQNTLGQLQSLRYTIKGAFDRDKTFQMLSKDLPDSPVNGYKDYFVHDVVRLCERFSHVKTNPTMNVRLDIVTTNKCRLFHEDYYIQRLLCTYLGPGTQWLDESNLNRAGLGKGCNTNIVRDFHLINTAKEFEVLLLTGAKYEGDKASIVHRSPPIEGTHITRVLLKVDE